jgi:hypothetical protein
MSVDYKVWLEGAKAELYELQRQKEALQAHQADLTRQEQEIDKRIQGMAQTVSGLASLVPEEPPEMSVLGVLAAVGKVLVDVGLTGRIRAILQAVAPRELSATEIRSELQGTGFYLGNYSNALAAIYTTLGRMAVSGEVVETPGPDGKRFKWNVSRDPMLVSALPSPSQMPQGLKGRIGTYRRKRIRTVQKNKGAPRLGPATSGEPKG